MINMHEFLKIVKEECISSDEAMDEIVVKLIEKNLQGDDKTDGHLDGYDSETGLKGKVYPGNIYIFKYSADKPTKYTYKNKDVFYFDDMPVLLVLKETEACLSGINLNFCSKGLRTLLLNMIQNLDSGFYNGGAADMYDDGKTVISNKVQEAINRPDSAERIYVWLKNLYDKADYSVIFRNYSKGKIQKFRLIEPWQWKWIPALDYYGTLKKDTMDAIQKLSGIDKITI